MKEDTYNSLMSALFLKDRKDVTWEQEQQAICYTLINTSSKRAKREKNVARAWIDNKKVYDMVS